MDALTMHCSSPGFVFLVEESSRNLLPTRAIRAFSVSSSSSSSSSAAAPKALSSSWFQFLQVPRKISSIGCPTFLERKSIRSIPLSYSSLSTASSEGDGDTLDSQVQSANQSKPVRVRFTLHKACLFGEHFLLVGDDPSLGLWEPLKAVPLEWSDGHVWSTELDLPIGKPIQFKFILRGLSGEIHWQPGPDRILQTWETTKTIVVSEDWENVDNQKTTEEEPLVVMAEEVTPSENKVGSNSRSVIEEKTGMNTIDEMQGGMTGEKLAETTNIKQLPNGDEGDLLLVPGLAPVPVSASASSLTEALNGNVTNPLLASSSEVEHCNTSQSSGKEGQPKPEILKHDLLAEETMKSSEKPHNNDSEDTSSCGGASSEGELHAEEPYSQEGDVLRNDIQWGQKTLHQFLSNLGFSMRPSLD